VRILLTNDDGYDAPGLRALYQAVSSLPEAQIDIIAPAVVQSGKGHATTEKFTCRPVTLEPMGRVIVVDGTPADCVRTAMHLPMHPRPDWVIAGINHGSNIGVDVYYSGTVAAVREAAILGIPAIAISQLVKSTIPDDWARSTRLATAVIAAICMPQQPPPPDADPEIHRCVQTALESQPLSAIALSGDQPVAPLRPMLDAPPPHRAIPPCWNVNLPRLAANATPLGARIAPISTDPLAFGFTHAAQKNDETLMTYVGRYHERTASPGTDVALVFSGYVTLSPLLPG
jgi:5'-nucleotidase